jgi:hypothetical protein
MSMTRYAMTNTPRMVCRAVKHIRIGQHTDPGSMSIATCATPKVTTLKFRLSPGLAMRAAPMWNGLRINEMGYLRWTKASPTRDESISVLFPEGQRVESFQKTERIASNIFRFRRATDTRSFSKYIDELKRLNYLRKNSMFNSLRQRAYWLRHIYYK